MDYIRTNKGGYRYATSIGSPLPQLAVLPLRNLYATLNEFEAPYDELGAVGVGLFASFVGRLLNDACFAPVFVN